MFGPIDPYKHRLWTIDTRLLASHVRRRHARLRKPRSLISPARKLSLAFLAWLRRIAT